MHKLEQTLSAFQEQILGKTSGFVDLVAKTTNPDAKQRIAIYRDSYTSRLVKALAANYPMLKNYLGEEEFFKLAMGYADTYPSHRHSIRCFGDKLPDYLQLGKHIEKAQLNELAITEWINSSLRDCKHIDKIKLETLRNLSTENWPKISLSFDPALKLINYKYNTIKLWESLYLDTPLPDRVEQPDKFIFWLDNSFSACYRSVAPTEAIILEQAIQGQTFASLCELTSLSVSNEKAAEAAAIFLLQWVNEGLITGYTIR